MPLPRDPGSHLLKEQDDYVSAFGRAFLPPTCRGGMTAMWYEVSTISANKCSSRGEERTNHDEVSTNLA